MIIKLGEKRSFPDFSGSQSQFYSLFKKYGYCDGQECLKVSGYIYFLHEFTENIQKELSSLLEHLHPHTHAIIKYKAKEFAQENNIPLDI